MHSIKVMWIVVGVVIVSGLVLIGYGLGTAKIGHLISRTSADYKTGYDAGREEARLTIANSGMFPPAPAEVRSVSGTVISVDGDKIIITGAGRISPNPLDQQGPDQRTISVTDKTAVTAVVPLTPAEFSAAMKKYNQTKQGMAPSPFYQKTVAIGDIKLTMAITVTATADIALSTNINADAITFNAIPSTVSP